MCTRKGRDKREGMCQNEDGGGRRVMAIAKMLKQKYKLLFSLIMKEGDEKWKGKCQIKLASAILY